jgi:hypothetical protein
VFDDLEHLLPEGPDQLGGEVRADAFDHPGTEVFLDPFQGTGWYHPQLTGLELQAMLTVVDPGPLAFDILARTDAGGAADHGDQLALAARLDAQHAETARFAVERDPFHRALQGFRGRSHCSV